MQGTATISQRQKTYTYEEALKASLEYFKGNEFAASVFLNKYALRNESNELVEKSPEDMHRRLAKEFARIEAKKFRNPLTEEEIFSYIEQFGKIIPQGSPMYAIGNIYQYVSASNCYVVESPLDSYGGICKVDEEMAQISKRRGGVGLDISNIRPAETLTRNAARTSTGVIPFSCRFSNTIREVGQSGRRGAQMQTISIHHPESVIPWDDEVDGTPFDVHIKNKDLGEYDVSSRYYNPNKVDFATCKYDPSKVTGANISIRLTDEFLNAVDEDKNFEQRWPVDSKKSRISKKVNARKVWDKIIHSAWRTGEPGLLFWDNILRESPTECYRSFGFASTSTNPCVTEDTWVMTFDGPRRVRDLIDNGGFDALVEGSCHSSDARGFWYTGDKETIILSTKEGYSIECTPDHKLLVVSFVNRKKITEWKMAKDIVEGDLLNLEDHSSSQWNGNGVFEEGYLLGSLIGDGCICGETAYLSWWGGTKEVMLKHVSDMANKVLNCRSDVGSGSCETVNALKYDRIGLNCKALKVLAEEFGLDEKKTISDEIEKASYEFYKGLLMGWFDADGTLNCDKEKQRCDVRLCSSVLDNLFAAQRMLARMGIISKIYQNRKEAGNRMMPDGNGSSKEYYCQASHELVITKSNIKKFADKIGFADPDKAKKLDSLLNSYGSRGFYSEKYAAEVSSIVQGTVKEVYDCSIEEAHCFDANGITAHNCGEIILSPYDSCRLLLLNLISFVKNPYQKDAYFDYDDFYKFAQIAQRLMDDLVDLEEECIHRIISKIEADPEPEDIKHRELDLWRKILNACVTGRRTGTGVTSVGDALAAMGVAYGSHEGIATVSKIYQTLKFGAYRCSVDMAKEISPFPIWNHELEKDQAFLNRIKHEKLHLSDNVTVDGADIWNDMKKYGRRNIALLTTAPAGSVSTLAKNVASFGTSSGIEPQYSDKPYKRNKKINPGDKNSRTDFIDQNGDHWQQYDIQPAFVEDWMKITGETDPNKSPWHNNCAEDINWELRVQLQAAANKHVDHSISSTVNLPETATVEDVAKIYKTAWKSGCKGITVYRDKCRTGVLVKDDASKKANPQREAAKRPKTLPCDVYHIKVRGDDFFVLVGMLNNFPYEIFAGKNGMIANVKKGDITKNSRGNYSVLFEDGSVISNVCDLITDEQAAIARLVSLSLRHGTDIKYVVEQIEKVPGDMTNLAKGVARALKKYIKDGTSVSGFACPNCQSGEVIRQEGCRLCRSCGWSGCS